MKTFVFKVIGITLLAIFALAAIVYAAFVIFAPNALASFYDGVGNYDRAVVYANGYYERTKEKGDLVTVCRYALKSEDDEKIEKYLDLLVDDEFYEFCLSDRSLGKDYYDFITGKLVLTVYRRQGQSSAVCERAKELTVEYSGSCALRSILFAAVEKKDETTIDRIKGYLEEMKATAQGAEKTLIETDLSNIEELFEVINI